MYSATKKDLDKAYNRAGRNSLASTSMSKDDSKDGGGSVDYSEDHV